MATNDKYRHILGRPCLPSPIAISLHFVSSSFEQIEGEITQCNNPKRPSYNFIVDGCKVKETVDRTDTAYAIPYPLCVTPVAEVCPELPECYLPPVIDTLLPTVNPNCKVISIAVSSPKNFGSCPPCNKCLAKLIADLQTQYSMPNNASTLFAFGMSEYDICKLIDCVQEVLDAPPVAPVPNPSVMLLCSTLSKFTSGTIQTIFGKDASGNCVSQPVSAISGGVPTIRLVINPATNTLDVEVNSVVSSSLPIIPALDAFGVQIGWEFAL